MKNLFYAIILTVMATGIVSCRQKEDNTLEVAAKSLYERSKLTTRLYTDSLGIARDSASVLRLSKRLEDEITKLNYSFPADTYLEFSEGANDTLVMLTTRFTTIRDSLLKRFGDPNIMLADSLRADSIAHVRDSLAAAKPQKNPTTKR